MSDENLSELCYFLKVEVLDDRAVEKQPEPQSEEVRIIEGKKYRKVFSGYTVREYYSHHTPEKGPGPGWDTFTSSPDKIAERYGICKKALEISPNDLPDEPLYEWEEIEDE